MSKKIKTLLFLSLALVSLFLITPAVFAKTPPKPVKKTEVVKKVVVTKKVVKKVVKPVKKAVVKKTATKNIPMNQLPNPNSAGSAPMKIYLKTINDARLTFKKEQAKAKTKEVKQAAEDKYSQAVQEAMDILSASKINTTTNTAENSSSTNQ